MSILLSPATLHVADLDEPVRAWLIEQRYDHFVGKHEGPLSWRDRLQPGSSGDVLPHWEVRPEAPDFVSVDGHDVLLPVDKVHHGQLRRVRAILSDDSRCLTLFLRDLSASEGPEAGRFAFCEQAPGASWYLCTVWHEWFATR